MVAVATLLTGDDLVTRAEAAAAVALPDALGVEFLDHDDPLVGVRFTVRGLAVTPAATLHSAALGAAMELAGYLAVLPTLDVAEHAVSHHVATQHLRPAHAGQVVRVTGHLDRRGRGLAFVSTTAEIDEAAGASARSGRRSVVALAQITKSIVSA